MEQNKVTVDDILDILLRQFADENRVGIVDHGKSPVKIVNSTWFLAVAVAFKNHFFFENLDEGNVRFLGIEDDDVVGLEGSEVDGMIEFLSEDFSELGNASVFRRENDQEI